MTPEKKVEKAEDLRHMLDKLGMPDVPVFALPDKPPTTAEHFFTNAKWVLMLQGFKFEESPKEITVYHGGEKIISAPTMNDLMLLLIITGAWSNAADGH